MSLQPSLPVASPEQNHANGQAAGTNGAAVTQATRLPKARTRRRGSRFLLPALAVVILGAVLAVWLIWFRVPTARTDLAIGPVQKKFLQLKIVERGALEARENRDIKCEVKTGSRGAPKIKWVVENGTYVNGAMMAWCGIVLVPGDPLVEIDDSYLQEQATTQKIARDKAEADWIAAKELYPLKKSAIALAIQNKQKWVNGDFPQQKHDLQGQIQTSESNLLQEEDRMAWVSRMVKKTYMTVSQEEAERALLMGNKLDLQKKQEQLDVLMKHTDPTTRQTMDNAILDAKVQERTAFFDEKTKKAVFTQQDALYKDLVNQIAQCKVTAPNSGIVVYFVPETTRMGSGANQSTIAQGEPVQFGQKMMSIPDLSHMLVNVRIHEAFINNMKTDLKCTIRVEAVSDKTLTGRIKMVANVASQQDWMSPDVKVYQAMVEITGVEGMKELKPGLSAEELEKVQMEEIRSLKLKPGLSAVCTIFTKKETVDEEGKPTAVPAIPIQAVVSPLEKGGKPSVFVKTPTGPVARDIKLGMDDGTFVEVKEGLKEGEDIILNPRTLLGDKGKKGAKGDEKKPGANNGGPEGGGKGKGNPGGPGSTPTLERK